MKTKTSRNLLIKIFQFLNRKFAYWLIFIIIGLVLFSTMYSNVKPTIYDVQKFQPAEDTIRSPITIEDEELTEKRRNEAVNQVQTQYIVKREYAENRVDLITSIYDSAIELQNQLLLKMKTESQEAPAGEITIAEPTTKEKVDQLKEKLTKEVIDELSEPTLEALVNNSTQDLSLARDAAVTAVNKVMTQRISPNEVENSKKQVEDELQYTSLPQDLKNATMELGRFAIIQNEFYDPEATEELRQQATENIEAVYIKQGQIIVEEGQLISQDIYRQLELLGLADTETDMMPYAGLALFVLILVALVYFHFNGDRKNETKHKELLIFSVIVMGSVLLMKGISLIPINQYEISYIFPAAMSAMLLKMILNERLGVIGTILLAATSAVIFNHHSTGSFHLTISLYILFSGLSSITFLTNHNQRSKIFQAGLFVSFINIILIIALFFIPNSKFSMVQYLVYIVMGIFSGVGSAVFTIGLLPFFEAGFGILSTMKLIELSNPNHPLLKKILTDAPGTYHHSIMVANLADQACEAIGANGLLARVASYYHDIGKTKRPNFFVENQMNIDNPHDKLPPETSRDIIIAHAKDGAEILKKNKMPKEIVDVAMQHHGTSLLKFFYHKAKEQGKEVEELDFRYSGPKPQTKETAIISISDSVEAAARSISNPSIEKIETLVKNIIKDKLNDDQFSDSDLTMKELKIIERTLCETLKGTYHHRIEYPELKKDER